MGESLFRDRSVWSPWHLLLLVGPAFALWAAWDNVTMAVGCGFSAYRQPSPGVYARYTSTIGVAPLTITSAAGNNYFVKFVDAQSNNPIIAFFVRGGEALRASMPAGRFILKTASGQTWCGERSLFGLETSLKEVQPPLVFVAGDGHTIRISPSRQGNLKLHGADLRNF